MTSAIVRGTLPPSSCASFEESTGRVAAKMRRPTTRQRRSRRRRFSMIDERLVRAFTILRKRNVLKGILMTFLRCQR